MPQYPSGSAFREIEAADRETNPQPVFISWREGASTGANLASLLDQLDLNHLSDEQVDKLKELLSIALKKDNPESE